MRRRYITPTSHAHDFIGSPLAKGANTFHALPLRLVEFLYVGEAVCVRQKHDIRIAALYNIETMQLVTPSHRRRPPRTAADEESVRPVPSCCTSCWMRRGHRSLGTPPHHRQEEVETAPGARGGSSLCTYCQRSCPYSPALEPG